MGGKPAPPVASQFTKVQLFILKAETDRHNVEWLFRRCAIFRLGKPCSLLQVQKQHVQRVNT